MQRPSIILVLLTLALLTLTSPVLGETVIIARDGHGVAHIKGDTDAGAFFGAGYAHAEDRLFQISLHRLIVQGRVAEFLGSGPPAAAPSQADYAELDRQRRLEGWARHAAREASLLGPENRALLDAFAQGVNAYIAQVRSGAKPKHPLFDATGIPLEDWTIADTLGMWVRFGSRFRPIDWAEPTNREKVDQQLINTGGDEQQVVDNLFGQRICDDDSAVVQESDVDPALLASMAAYAQAKGQSTATNCAGGVAPPPPEFSHVWAVSSDRVVEGIAALVGDPRVGLEIPGFLYEWHMIGETFDVRGAGAPGCPYMLSGSTRDVAWSLTALGPDQADLFKLDVDLSATPPTYVLDLEDGQGPQTVAMNPVETEEIKIKDQPSEQVTYRGTHFGPLVTELVQVGSLGPNDGYALKALPFSHPRLSNIEGFINMYRAADVDSFRTALEGFIFPGANAVFADSGGRIGYVANGAHPVRAAEFLAGYQSLDGNTIANDWQEFLPHDFKPWVVDPDDGAIFSANHRPIGSFYPLPFVSSALGEGNRSWRLRQLIDTGEQMTLFDIYQIHLSCVLPSAEGLTQLAEAIQVQDPAFPNDPDAQTALGHLSSWLAAGAEMTNEHPATYLASEVPTRFAQTTGGGTPSPLAGIYGGKGVVTFLKVKLAELAQVGAAALPLNDDEKDFVREALIFMYQETVSATFSTDPNVWQQRYFAENLAQIYGPASGLGNPPWSTFEGIFADVTLPVFTHAPPRCTEGGTLMEQGGQSFTQFVAVGAPNVSFSVLPPGVREWCPPENPACAPGAPLDLINGLPIDVNQEPFWSGIGADPPAAVDVKASPITQTGISQLTGGFLSVESLTFPSP